MKARGISGNEPDRLLANARAAGDENRLEIKKGSQQSIAEMARVLRPGGQFLLMVLNTDAYVEFAIFSSRSEECRAESRRPVRLTDVLV
jgi:hypothetical protein